MAQRYQKNITITPEQENFARLNYGKMSNLALSKKIGVPYFKTLNNLRVMGLYTPKEQHAIVVNMKGYFDVDKFKKYYKY